VTVVVGTAGHIDHGKTSLLRALTGIDADRLPEEQRRGMTIDVGYAHLTLDDGGSIDFVDVPGHDRLVGNMLVGAGEIDAALLVVAADDGPRAQTLEHLGLLDALGIDDGIAVVTKADLVPESRVADVRAMVGGLLDGTSLRGVPVLPVSSATGAGLDAVRAALIALAGRVRTHDGPPRLAIDRVFTVRGRGVVVTGSLRGGTLTRGDILRVVPGGGSARVREVQVHNRAVDMAGPGRVALNLAGVEAGALRRGLVLTRGPGVEASDRLLVALRAARGVGLRHGAAVRLHLGTEQAAGTLDLGRRAAALLPGGRTTAIVRLDAPIAAAFGDSIVIRRLSPAETLAGGTVLDPRPPRGVSRRRATPAALAALDDAASLAPIVALHGTLPADRVAAWTALAGKPPTATRSADPQSPSKAARSTLAGDVVADDVRAAIECGAVDAVGDGVALADVRVALVTDLRRHVTLDRAAAVDVVGAVIDDLVGRGRLVRDGDRLLPAGAATGPSEELRAAMDRLEAMLTTPTPPGLREAAAAARCPIDGIRALEADGRIVRIEDDLAWSAATLREFEAAAIRLAAAGPMAPATFRDAIGSSRRYAMAILEDLDRRGILRRTPAGHVPGPRAAMGARR
jgi:selenocysteine-specific elongation factor